MLGTTEKQAITLAHFHEQFERAQFSQEQQVKYIGSVANILSHYGKMDETTRPSSKIEYIKSIFLVTYELCSRSNYKRAIRGVKKAALLNHNYSLRKALHLHFPEDISAHSKRIIKKFNHNIDAIERKYDEDIAKTIIETAIWSTHFEARDARDYEIKQQKLFALKMKLINDKMPLDILKVLPKPGTLLDNRLNEIIKNIRIHMLDNIFTAPIKVY